MRRLGGAGAVAVGKTNLDEFAMGSSTENSAFGPTRNPWDIGRVPGGSSGGSAAAVAPGMVPLSFGSDTGGSIRQPASLCGIVGVKPTYGVVSRYGLIAFASSLDQIGPVRDDGRRRGARPRGDRRPRPDGLDLARTARARACSRRSTRACRGCGSASSRTSCRAPPSAGEVVVAAAEALAAAGAKVDQVTIPELLLGLPAYYVIAPAEASSNLSRYDGVRYGLRVDGPDAETMNARTRGEGFGPEVKRRIMMGTYALSAGYYDAYYGQAQKARTLVIRAFEAAYRNFDVLLTPTTPVGRLPVRVQGRRPDRDVHVRPVHHPLQPGGPSGRQRALRA